MEPMECVEACQKLGYVGGAAPASSILRLEPSWVITWCIYRTVHRNRTEYRTFGPSWTSNQGVTRLSSHIELQVLVVFNIQDFRLLTLLVLGIQEVEATEYNGTITAGLCLPIEAGSNRDRSKSCR